MPATHTYITSHYLKLKDFFEYRWWRYLSYPESFVNDLKRLIYSAYKSKGDVVRREVTLDINELTVEANARLEDVIRGLIELSRKGIISFQIEEPTSDVIKALTSVLSETDYDYIVGRIRKEEYEAIVNQIRISFKNTGEHLGEARLRKLSILVRDDLCRRLRKAAAFANNDIILNALENDLKRMGERFKEIVASTSLEDSRVVEELEALLSKPVRELMGTFSEVCGG